MTVSQNDISLSISGWTNITLSVPMYQVQPHAAISLTGGLPASQVTPRVQLDRIQTATGTPASAIALSCPLVAWVQWTRRSGS